MQEQLILCRYWCLLKLFRPIMMSFTLHFQLHTTKSFILCWIITSGKLFNKYFRLKLYESGSFMLSLSCICYAFVQVCFLCLVVPCWERADLSFVMSVCEVVTFPLVSWVRCGAWLYWFLIFAVLFYSERQFADHLKMAFYHKISKSYKQPWRKSNVSKEHFHFKIKHVIISVRF